MANKFSLRLVTPSGVATECEAESLVLPGVTGSLGVLAGHESWVVLLKDGPVAWKPAGGAWTSVKITGGVADITASRTVVLADATTK